MENDDYFSGSFDVLSCKKRIMPIDVRKFVKDIIEVDDELEENWQNYWSALPKKTQEELDKDQERRSDLR